MINITLKEAVEAIMQLFDTKSFNNKEEGKSFYVEEEHGGTTFFLDKRQYWRDDIIDKVSEYFKDKYITDGQCRISSITFLWTQVYLEPVGYQNRSQEEIQAERKTKIEKYCENWEKYRDSKIKYKNGSVVELKNIPDDELRNAVKKKLARDISTYRLFQGEIMYRINKDIWNPTKEE